MATTPPPFASIADPNTQRAFVNGRPEAVEWLVPGTKLFKWTQSITNGRGISPWWQFLMARTLPGGAVCLGIREMQEHAANTGSGDRNYARVRAAVTEQWNKMTNAVAIELVRGTWGYIGKAAGQLKNSNDPKVFFIGGDYQVWVPGLVANDIRRISLLPYLQPNTAFGAR